MEHSSVDLCRGYIYGNGNGREEGPSNTATTVISFGRDRPLV